MPTAEGINVKMTTENTLDRRDTSTLIEEQLAVMTDNIDGLGRIIDHLELSIINVLGQGNDSGEKRGPRDEIHSCSPLRLHLMAHNMSLESRIDRLSDIVDRVEL